MLFVYDNQLQIRNRRKHRQARAKNNIGIAAQSRKPAARAFAVRQCAVQNCYAPLRKPPRKRRFQLRRKMNLRR